MLAAQALRHQLGWLWGRLALATHPVWPSALSYCVGTPEGLMLSHEGIDFAAAYPARTFPCQRFVVALAGRDA